MSTEFLDQQRLLLMIVGCCLVGFIGASLIYYIADLVDREERGEQ